MQAMAQAIFSVEFGAVCVVVVALATAIKRTVQIKRPTFPTGRFGKAVMSWLNLALGAAAAVPQYLQGDAYFERMMLGIIAGFVSVFVYNGFTKHAFPGKKTDKDGGPPTAPTAVP